MAATFTYLVRFIDTAGETCYGSLAEQVPASDLEGKVVPLLLGDIVTGFTSSKEERTIAKLLCPLAATPVIHCVGVNYAKHAREADFKVPEQPVVFLKPADALAGPFEKVYVHSEARPQLDYEGELCFIFGKDGKDVAEAEALNFVLAYTIGNDITARNFIPQEVSGFQMGYGKSFDAFNPIGPYLVSPEAVGNPHNLQLETKVNGEVRQSESTSDMIWTIPQIIAHLTKGRTVRAGTVVMTGTPSGVGWFMNPPGYVKDGDVVDITIEKLGTLSNTVTYDKA